MPIWKKYAHLQKWACWICPFEYAHYLTFCVNMPICNMPIILKNQKVCPFAIWQKFQKSVEIWPFPKVMNYKNYIFICISTLWKFGINICLLNLNGHIWTYTHLQYAHFLVIYKNMPICRVFFFPWKSKVPVKAIFGSFWVFFTDGNFFYAHFFTHSLGFSRTLFVIFSRVWFLFSRT